MTSVDVPEDLAVNDCAGRVTQQEVQQLGIPLDVANTFDPARRRLCGFGAYRGLDGHVDEADPAVVLLDQPDGERPATLFGRYG